MVHSEIHPQTSRRHPHQLTGDHGLLGLGNYLPDRWVSRLVVLVFILLAYGPILNVPFLFDDHEVIERNENLKHWSWQDVRDDFHPTAQSPWGQFYYRPLQMLSHRLDVTLYGLHPWGHHLTNLLLHILASWLVIEIGAVLGLSEMACLLSGTFFGVHPIIIAEQLMVCGRPELLSMVFSLAAVLLFSRKTRSAALLGGLSFFAALLSKESALSVPFFVGLVYWIRGDLKNLWPKIWALAGVLGLYAAVRLQAVGVAHLPLTPLQIPIFLIVLFPRVLLCSLRLLVFPWPLYLYRFLPDPSIFLGITILIAVIVVWQRWLRSKTLWTFGLLWFIAGWIPKITMMISGRFMPDSWAYPSLPGLIWPLASELMSFSHDSAAQVRVKKMISVGLLILWTSSTRLNTALRNTDQKNYEWSLQYTRSVPIYVNLGLIYLRAGHPDEAMSYFKPALDAYPDDPTIQAAYNAALKALQTKPNPSEVQ